jgi:hypothetical protein
MKKHLLQRERFCALLFCFVGFFTFYGRNCQAGKAAQPSTFCNPLNLLYRFSLESPSRREAADPAQGQWMPVGSLQGNQDPALFVDRDGKVCFYYGSSATDAIKGVELDASSFAQIGSPQSLITGDPLKHGWELKDPNATDAEIASGMVRLSSRDRG